MVHCANELNVYVTLGQFLKSLSIMAKLTGCSLGSLAKPLWVSLHSLCKLAKLVFIDMCPMRFFLFCFGKTLLFL